METVAVAVTLDVGRKAAAPSVGAGAGGADAIEAMKRTSEATMKHVIS